jgi:hypothetical protein
MPPVLSAVKYVVSSYSLLLALALIGCTVPKEPQESIAPLRVVRLDQAVKIVSGQTLYVSIYSHIYMWDQSRSMNLTATLSVRNTDQLHPMIITAVDYYDSSGKLIRKYLEQPVELGAMASTSFVVQQEDKTGGVGAAFVVEWVAQKDITSPIVESIMINASGNQGLSFISSGRVIKTRTNRQPGEKNE